MTADNTIMLPATVTPGVNRALIGTDWVWAWVPDVWGAGGWTKAMLRTEAVERGLDITEPRPGQEPRY